VDNEYWIWSFQGRLIRKHVLERFCQLLWRPRPASLLSGEKVREIKKNIKQYSAQFEIKDKMTLMKASKDIIEKKKKIMNDFREYRKKRKADTLDRKAQLYHLRGITKDEEDNEKIEEETIEFFVREEVFELKDDEL
jgi:eukaryotic translation initiation factor 3 subunit B